jgi:hypothetical protein
MTDPRIAEYFCEGCGVHVSWLMRSEPPANHMCATCGWLSEFVRDPNEFWEIYDRLIIVKPMKGAKRDA